MAVRKYLRCLASRFRLRSELRRHRGGTKWKRTSGRNLSRLACVTALQIAPLDAARTAQRAVPTIVLRDFMRAGIWQARIFLSRSCSSARYHRVEDFAHQPTAMKICRFKDHREQVHIGLLADDFTLFDLAAAGIHELQPLLES